MSRLSIQKAQESPARISSSGELLGDAHAGLATAVLGAFAVGRIQEVERIGPLGCLCEQLVGALPSCLQGGPELIGMGDE